jgi:flagellar hook-associated protein 3 FlgL
MRVASTQFQDTMNTALQLASSRVAALTEQMASGQRLMVPSDDPLTSVRLSRLTGEESAIAQYRDNIGALKTRLQQSESYLDGMTSDVQQARDLLVGALDGANSSADLAAKAAPLQALSDSLLFAANSKDQEGRYVFSGTATATQGITFDPNAPAGTPRYTFTGNTLPQNVVVSSGVTQPANVSVPEVADMLNKLDDAIRALQTPGVNVSDPATHAIVAAGLDGIDAGMDAISSTIATLGGRQNIIATLDTNHANVSLSNQQSLIDLGQLDYGSAAIALTDFTTALQATQKSYAKISGLSLFNVL